MIRNVRYNDSERWETWIENRVKSYSILHTFSLRYYDIILFLPINKNVNLSYSQRIWGTLFTSVSPFEMLHRIHYQHHIELLRRCTVPAENINAHHETAKKCGYQSRVTGVGASLGHRRGDRIILQRNLC